MSQRPEDNGGVCRGLIGVCVCVGGGFRHHLSVQKWDSSDRAEGLSSEWFWIWKQQLKDWIGNNFRVETGRKRRRGLCGEGGSSRDPQKCPRIASYPSNRWEWLQVGRPPSRIQLWVSYCLTHQKAALPAPGKPHFTAAHPLQLCRAHIPPTPQRQQIIASTALLYIWESVWEMLIM